MENVSRPLPVIDSLSKPFWEAAHRHELSMQQCTTCTQFVFPRSPICPTCRTETLEWKTLSGEGKVWSFTVFHKLYFSGLADQLPYNVAIVELDEGPRIFTNLVEIQNEDISVGLPVLVTYEDVTPEVTLIKFRPGK